MGAFLIATTTLPLRGQDIVAGQDDDSQIERLIFLHDSGPVVIGVHVNVEGMSHSAAWLKGVRSMFDDLDKDKNGTLDSTESRGIPTVRELRNAPQDRVVRSSPDAQPQESDLPELNSEGLVAHLKEFAGPFTVTATSLRSAALGGVVATFRSTTNADPAALKLFFDRLDRDGNGMLAAEEFQATTRLLKLDVDEDGSISRQELSAVAGGAASQFFMATRAQNQQPTKAPLLAVSDDETTQESHAAQIISHYDGKRSGPNDGQLTQVETGFRQGAFATADRDESSQLDADEVVQWMRTVTPDIHINVRQSLPKPGTKPVEITIRDSSFAKSRDIEIHESVLAIGKVRLQMTVQYAISAMADMTAAYAQQFSVYDRDGNGYLDFTEARRSPFCNSFTPADVDGDEKLFKEEFVSYMSRLATLQKARTVLTANDQGRELFEILDRNRDGRVSGTELAVGAAKVKDWDDNDNQQLSIVEVPNVWQLIFGRGGNSGMMRMAVATATPGLATPAAGVPAWFGLMDRNRDSELARREFLGPLEDFQRLDKNGDGLLVAEEVASPAASD
jgi:Ca2+-binding EF-hand superfamily protein